MREPNGSDFSIDVDGVGHFVFGRRTQKDKYLIRSVYSRMTNDYYKEDGTVGDMEAWMHATLEVLTVSQPESFDPDKLDPILDENTGAKIEKVFMALRNKELSFRPKPATGESKSGSGSDQ